MYNCRTAEKIKAKKINFLLVRYLHHTALKERLGTESRKDVNIARDTL